MRLLIAAALALSLGRAAAAECRVSTHDLEFGAYSGGQSAPLDANTTLRLDCHNDGSAETVHYSLLISPSASGAHSPRAMTQGSERLEYELYTSGARNQVWGDGLLSGLAPAGALLLPAQNSAEWILFGRIFGAQRVPSGSYRDVLQVTVEY